MNGSIAALTCKNGDINVRAWNYFVAADSRLMTLKRSALWSQVVAASCVEVRGTTNPAVLAIYRLVSAYNDWHFGFGTARILQLDDRRTCDHLGLTNTT